MSEDEQIHYALQLSMAEEPTTSPQFASAVTANKEKSIWFSQSSPGVDVNGDTDDREVGRSNCRRATLEAGISPIMRPSTHSHKSLPASLRVEPCTPVKDSTFGSSQKSASKRLFSKVEETNDDDDEVDFGTRRIDSLGSSGGIRQRVGLSVNPSQDKKLDLLKNKQYNDTDILSMDCGDDFESMACVKMKSFEYESKPLSSSILPVDDLFSDVAKEAGLKFIFFDTF